MKFSFIGISDRENEIENDSNSILVDSQHLIGSKLRIQHDAICNAISRSFYSILMEINNSAAQIHSINQMPNLLVSLQLSNELLDSSKEINFCGFIQSISKKIHDLLLK